MKLPLLCLFLTTGTLSAATAQTPASTAAVKRTEEYCQVVAQAKLNGRYVVSIDYGQQQKLVSANLFRDASGKAVEFNSAMDALNWLNAQGWELASTFIDPANTGAYYVMRRRIQ
ncbi:MULTISPECIES: hypothetical protein [Hymenobacter]|uniref:DUF4177 domain-containing protein n=1 Tax=Hymenobacter armeniacus TaxID=2771358 RepID=A0ABR8JVW8_9BACT|nr:MULTISPECIES: hypothetical protein [Hymenobacter]MBD2723056.1 hypothetical protein [Hymenobacter armeniacus]MBJ6109107.1 hypothetical protein [Hymenobacter sp. BT523]